MAASNTDENTITVVELGHNSSQLAEKAVDRSISMEKYQQLLQDTGKVDCPLLARLGYPAILVSTTPGQKVIPAVRYSAMQIFAHTHAASADFD